MRKWGLRLWIVICGIFIQISSMAQCQITGSVQDAETHEPIIGATIAVGSKGTITDKQGFFTLPVVCDSIQIKISYTGYETQVKTIQSRNKMVYQIQLQAQHQALQMVTISGSKFEKRAAEEVVSIEVIKPNYMLNTANNAVDDALQRVPGVDVVDNQVNIRGGSGWSYGAGSRVLVLVDDMPMITADAGDAKWDFLPIENCEQIEVLKGAASSLYGSSALNGVVHFRTGFARSKPRTKAMLYNGMYGNPANASWKWWGKQQPGFQGGYISHAQKFGQLDAVIGAAWYSEDSYLQGDLNRRARMNTNLRYRFKKISGLFVGLNANAQINKSQTFFFWQPDASGTKYYQPFGGLNDSTTTINKNQGQRIHVDPYIQYQTANGAKHILRTRWFRSKNDIPEKKQSSTADTYFGEYQFQKKWSQEKGICHQLQLVSGIVGSYSQIEGLLYGNHTTANMAPYVQLEKKWRNWWLSAGVRYELNHVDTYAVEKKPVFRSGINYQAGQATFIRASYGQGYRYPSIAERFVNTSFGASRVFPNPALQSETGWSAEVGIKQGFAIGKWMGYLDVAGFWMEYKNMMEFNFNFYLPPDSTFQQVANPLSYLGFRSINVGNTRINGIDASCIAQGKIGKADIRFLGAYTYMNPVLLNPDSVIMANVSGETKTLKYRYRHTAKMDIEGNYHKITIGTTCLYNSFMQNIDEVFQNTKPMQNAPGALFELGTQLPSSVNAFRTRYNKGAFVWDLRAAIQINKQIKLAFITKNILNTVYAERPALVAPPRNFTLQLAVDL